ncbi:MAG TPA: YbjN domain-containing protein [Rhizomicrobium sp.]|nr:YbjN domain-containing protein [Rhizomicrobium sp.]
MRTAIVAALALTLASATASARDIPAAGLSTQDVINWLRSMGYSTEIVQDNNGSSHIRSNYNGLKLGVYMFDCKDNVCGSLQFSVGWATHGKFDTSQMNAWNRDKRWCRGYFDSENDPWVERDIDLTPGGSYEMLADEFQIFRKCVDNFKTIYQL